MPTTERELLTLIEQTQPERRLTWAHATLLNNLAVVYHSQGRFNESDVTHKECIALIEQLCGAGNVRPVAQSLANRAALYRTFHEYTEAERLQQLAMKI